MMARYDKRRDLNSYRKKVKAERYKANKLFEEDPESVKCHICRQPIDMSLPYSDALAWTLEHLTPISQGGHILGATLYAHRRCNAAKGDQIDYKPPQGLSGREW